ncbi:MAG TPA: tetratricopeptide repeat protein [Steroidobacteraceae bacterium]|jgi:tetratricopeptide (TPR) repeat protein|nr:tetratricopeptide repeat protein [Steroidobacteraceae bacterium]
MMHVYDHKALKRQFGVSASAIRSLIRSRHIHPATVGENARYSFRDLLVLRMVSALTAARIPWETINVVLENMRGSLPGASLHAVSLIPPSAEDRKRKGGMVGVFRHAKLKSPGRLAQRYFERALGLEDKDLIKARAAYAQSLAIDPHHVEARLNLGRLLHLGGEHAAAEEVYRAGLTANALLSFNLALLLEDLDRESEAILTYREALAHDPRMADAHFNLARLHEKAGRSQDAFRHLLSHRRLISDTSALAGKPRRK